MQPCTKNYTGLQACDEETATKKEEKKKITLEMFFLATAPLVI